MWYTLHITALGTTHFLSTANLYGATAVIGVRNPPKYPLSMRPFSGGKQQTRQQISQWWFFCNLSNVKSLPLLPNHDLRFHQPDTKRLEDFHSRWRVLRAVHPLGRIPPGVPEHCVAARVLIEVRCNVVHLDEQRGGFWVL